jgi:hypothetical protein
MAFCAAAAVAAAAAAEVAGEDVSPIIDHARQTGRCTALLAAMVQAPAQDTGRGINSAVHPFG